MVEGRNKHSTSNNLDKRFGSKPVYRRPGHYIYVCIKCKRHCIRLGEHAYSQPHTNIGARQLWTNVLLLLMITYLKKNMYHNDSAGPSGCAVQDVGIRPLACWDRGFESHHGCLSVVSVVCSQAEVSATDWSPVQRSSTECGASLCVTKKPRTRGYSPLEGCKIQPHNGL